MIGAFMNKSKSLIRASNRTGNQSGKTVPAERRTGRLSEPAVCEGCGAVFSRRAWRRTGVTETVLKSAAWTRCPACKQAASGDYCGRVVIRGDYALEHEGAIRKRIANVEARAQFTQPQRRIVAAQRDGTVFEVLTTSQKLAHRIVSELKKAFRGRAIYKWSDDGSLFAVWQRDS
jgi:hypothetical protein